MGAAEGPALLGVVLAGGAGRRLGGDKAGAMLAGRPLVAWVAEALGAVTGEVVVVAKEASTVPALVGVEVWREPASPVHPLAGIVWALSRAGGRDVLVCAVDLPFCRDAVRAVSELACGSAAGASVVLADGQPLLGVYRASVVSALREAVRDGRPARATVAGLGGVQLAVAHPERALFNVNTPEDLARAEAMVAGGGRAAG